MVDVDSVIGKGPWPIGAPCVNCGAELAWRSGVGRVVISHAHGSDRCLTSSPVARLADHDRATALAALDELDARLKAAAGGE